MIIEMSWNPSGTVVAMVVENPEADRRYCLTVGREAQSGMEFEDTMIHASSPTWADDHTLYIMNEPEGIAEVRIGDHAGVEVRRHLPDTAGAWRMRGGYCAGGVVHIRDNKPKTIFIGERPIYEGVGDISSVMSSGNELVWLEGGILWKMSCSGSEKKKVAETDGSRHDTFIVAVGAEGGKAKYAYLWRDEKYLDRYDLDSGEKHVVFCLDDVISDLLKAKAVTTSNAVR
ncbi:MAG: hypothetical protein WC869_12860 [Phycisphaerae bacterium]|jgi:hypothetical protein